MAMTPGECRGSSLWRRFINRSSTQGEGVMGKEGAEGKSGGLLVKAVGAVFALVLAPVIVAAILKFTGIHDSSSGGGEKDKPAKNDSHAEAGKDKGRPPDTTPKPHPGPLFAFN